MRDTIWYGEENASAARVNNVNEQSGKNDFSHTSVVQIDIKMWGILWLHFFKNCRGYEPILLFTVENNKEIKFKILRNQNDLPDLEEMQS